MSWIRELDEDTQDPGIAALYERLRAERGRVSNILKVHSLRPAALGHHFDLYMGLLFGPGGLSRAQREMIAVVVSRANHCEYCVSHHREALARYLLLANLVVSYFNFVNRIALGLGVEHNEDEVRGYKG
jgi:uncharacterized peroxidase-related enzyme